MSKRGDRQLLLDMLEALLRIRSYISGMSYEEFLSDLKTQDSVIRALEILGEACKGVSVKIKTDHPFIPWKNIAGQRDILIHNYFGINLDIVWETITLDLPSLELKVTQILEIIEEHP
jgi:uncharacterized protein with HEPN domain